MNIENFENAFRTSTGSCLFECKCGRRFFNSNGGWDWEDGELEELEEDNTATDLDWSVGSLYFDSAEYARDCDCWHDRAKNLMGLIDRHSRQLAEYLNSEKDRKTKEAKLMPTVK